MSTNKFSRTLNVPSNVVGIIIGKNGAGVKKIKSVCGYNTRIIAKPTSNNFTNIIVSTISSSMLDKACSMIFSRSKPIKIEFTVPKNKVGVIIGKGGSTVKSIAIKAGTGCRIQHTHDGIFEITAPTKTIANLAVEYIKPLLNSESHKSKTKSSNKNSNWSGFNLNTIDVLQEQEDDHHNQFIAKINRDAALIAKLASEAAIKASKTKFFSRRQLRDFKSQRFVDAFVTKNHASSSPVNSRSIIKSMFNDINSDNQNLSNNLWFGEINGSIGERKQKQKNWSKVRKQLADSKDVNGNRMYSDRVIYRYDSKTKKRTKIIHDGDSRVPSNIVDEFIIKSNNSKYVSNQISQITPSPSDFKPLSSNITPKTTTWNYKSDIINAPKPTAPKQNTSKQDKFLVLPKPSFLPVFKPTSDISDIIQAANPLDSM